MRIGAVEGIVSVIIPCLNEETAIGALVHDLLAAGIDEAIVVDGGSADRTVETACAAGARIVVERVRGYGRACAAGIAAARTDAAILAFMDGDGSDSPSGLLDVLGPVLRGEADFAIGSRLRGPHEPGSLSMQQAIAGRLAGALIRLVYGARFTDMAPCRAITRSALSSLAMQEMTYGWNLEMQMRVAAARIRLIEVPVGCRHRRGGVSKVSGNLAAVVPATVVLTTTFVRLFLALRRAQAFR
jgi:glycosyltransferase involved in cell wall biosynthesis